MMWDHERAIEAQWAYMGPHVMLYSLQFMYCISMLTK